MLCFIQPKINELLLKFNFLYVHVDVLKLFSCKIMIIKTKSGSGTRHFLGVMYFGFRFRVRVSIGGRVMVSCFGSFRFSVGARVRFGLGPGTQLDPIIIIAHESLLNDQSMGKVAEPSGKKSKQDEQSAILFWVMEVEMLHFFNLNFEDIVNTEAGEAKDFVKKQKMCGTVHFIFCVKIHFQTCRRGFHSSGW